ncbi:hypothetical protein [Streptomyces mirabilis]|uniref:hypothetical protein n=1 Tax=Streptomyces mirabilis TaxID=68239 RepID=UPI0036855342
MDDLAALSGTAPADRADRAREAWELYASTYGGSEICDLITDLMHLADLESEDGGPVALATAELHYDAEI